jgi:phage-related minor tail protein
VSSREKSASSAESVAQKLANLKQQAELAAGSTQELSREQAMLNAEQSLGKGATQAQIAQARQYAAEMGYGQCHQGRLQRRSFSLKRLRTPVTNRMLRI